MKKVEGDRCLVFVPEGSGSHPVLCFLHGAGEAGADRNGKPQSLATVLKNGSPAWHAEKGSAFMSRFLVICPQLERRRRWESSDAPWVDSIVQAAVREHGGDLSRSVLTGFSYGGEGAFQMRASASWRGRPSGPWIQRCSACRRSPQPMFASGSTTGVRSPARRT
jgi:predicted peptidase